MPRKKKKMGQAKQRGSREQRIAEAKARRPESSAVREFVSARNRYADQWEISSPHFFDAGYYDWMADKVNGRTAVLEIGCGVGYDEFRSEKAKSLQVPSWRGPQVQCRGPRKSADE